MGDYSRVPSSPLPQEDEPFSPFSSTSTAFSASAQLQPRRKDSVDEKMFESVIELPRDRNFDAASLTRNVQRRHFQYFLVLLAIAILTLLRVSFPSTASTPLSTPRKLHPTLVGPRPSTARDGKALYTSCTADELLAAIKTAQIKPDGASLFPNFTKPESVAMAPIEWSFELGELEDGKQCELPKVYSPEETCELLSAFGGVFLTGDSFIRHLHSALLMLLRGRIDGATKDFLTTDDCRGDMLFDDGKLCRQRIISDTNVEMPVCGNEAQVGFLQTYRPDHNSFKTFFEWRSRLPTRSHLYSPIYITGVGGHMDYSTATLVPEYFDGLFSTLSRHYPTPLNLFAGPHKPGKNQHKMFLQRQGPKKVQTYAEEVPLLLESRSKEKELARGGARYIDYYAMSDGATSFDGVHYSYQINQEKVQILLNLLDIAWGEIVAAGGMVVADS
ncbi:hypothetical protein JCM10207_008791 [Rhodosporidiobolus poonsookiae]